MTVQVVGISGKAETGKDYLRRTVFEAHGFRPWSLAWHFKIWLIGQGKATYEEVFETKPPHIRELLQQEGTERGRNVFGEDIWCNTAAAWIDLLAREWHVPGIVIPDVRFPNEVEMVHRLGGKVVRIRAPQRVETSRLSAEARGHFSETALDNYDNFDLYVDNDPGAPSLLEQCAPLLSYHVVAKELAAADELTRLSQEMGLYP